MATAFEKMDRMYRHQAYFYDLTRKYYLLGRDRLISEFELLEGDSILEVGCGTGRNLMILARTNPKVDFFGIDASDAMLKTAERKIAAAKFNNVRTEKALAENFSFQNTFGISQPFDSIYFSYSISMIPAWELALDNALNNLKTGGLIYIVDFFDQGELPRVFRRILTGWLKRFHVRYPAGLVPHLEKLERSGNGALDVMPLYKGYSFLARFRKC